MNFTPGRSADGRVPLLADGKPVFMVCAPYTLSRTVMNAGIVVDAWVRISGETYAHNLAAAVKFATALAACERHQRESNPQVS